MIEKKFKWSMEQVMAAFLIFLSAVVCAILGYVALTKVPMRRVESTRPITPELRIVTTPWPCIGGYKVDTVYVYTEPRD